MAYTERLDQYFIANGVDDAGKQRAILLGSCGAKAYKVIKSLIAPAKPTDKTFQQLVEIVSKHFDPVPAITVQRYKFNVRIRQPGENVATFLSELRLLATKCDFQNSLEDMLRDRIVIGVNDPNIQRRLLAEPNLTALEIAQALETAERGSADLQPAPAGTAVSVPVNAVGRQRRGVNKDPVKCFRCGGKHLATACKFIDAECFNCGKKGHTYRVCRSKGKPSKSTGKRGRPQKPQKAHTVTTEGDCIVEHLTLNLSSRDASTIAPFVVSVQVDDKYLKMEVDTGASVSLISERTWYS